MTLTSLFLTAGGTFFAYSWWRDNLRRPVIGAIGFNWDTERAALLEGKNRAERRFDHRLRIEAHIHSSKDKYDAVIISAEAVGEESYSDEQIVDLRNKNFSDGAEEVESAIYKLLTKNQKIISQSNWKKRIKIWLTKGSFF
jgi:hypothetical protein